MKCIFAALLLFFTLSASSQEDFYLYNKTWEQISKPEEAVYFARRLRIDDTTWKWDVYNFTGPLITTQYFRDKGLTQKNGLQYFYHSSGYLDSSGNVANGLQNGDWNFFNDTGGFYLKKNYNNGVLVSTEGPKENLDTSTKSDEHESTFRGGSKQWIRYLTKNMQYPERAMNLRKTGMVVTNFIVNAAGNVSDVTLFKSTKFSLDEESMRLIQRSP
jgi:protein TonB